MNPSTKRGLPTVLKGEGLAYNIIPALSITVDCCWRCSQPQRTSAQRSMSGGSVKYGAVSVLHLASLRHWCVSRSDKWRGISVAAGTVGPAGCFKISAGLACQAVSACICPGVPPPPQHGPPPGGRGLFLGRSHRAFIQGLHLMIAAVGGDHLTWPRRYWGPHRDRRSHHVHEISQPCDVRRRRAQRA